MSSDPGSTDPLQFYEKFTRKELQIQFSPHHFCRRDNYDKAQLLTDHFEISREGTNQVREELSCILDYHYGVQESQSFDIYGTDLGDKAPVFFWVHGGGWQFGSKNLNGFFAGTLHRWGFKTIVFGYSLAPRSSVTQMVEELKDGLRAAFKLNPKSDFVVGGHSAGAHLVSCILHDQLIDCRQIKKVVLVSGIYDLRPFTMTVFNAIPKITGNEADHLSGLLQTKCNPHFQEKDVKVFLTSGKFESQIFLNHAHLYSQHLKKLGADTTCWIADQDDHFSIIENLMDQNEPITKNLKNFIIDLVPRRGFFRLCKL
ncbi:unnamed protein product [Allacma fusca]|uniref:Alpha/beta hydrolase fold-3 domain-containing protein n=1 Tax=Allacma fusca TaxID=39272 RepID=A0A8J2JZN0_9HEXA|nr:unnamed protein product [Allacma fusca]